MYENVNEPLISRRAFGLRMVRHGAVAIALLAGSLVIGMVGYAVLAEMRPVDAFVNAAMILGGMGPVDPLTNDAAKLFAGVYAIYSGVVFLVAVGAIFAPALHRVLHKLHLAGAATDHRDTGSTGADGG